MEPLQIAKAINSRIQKLEELVKELQELARCKAESLANYEKTLALTIMQLRNGEEFEIDGKRISDPPVSIIEKVARGICAKELLDKEISDGAYKNQNKIIDVVQSQMLGYQSINKHLDKVN